MKICNIILSMNVGGAEHVVSMMSNKLAKEKKDLSIILLVKTSQWPIFYKLNKKIKIYETDLFKSSKSILEAIKLNFTRINKIRKLLKKINPDVIIAHCPREIALTFVACLGMKKKIIGYLHSDPNNLKEDSFFWKVLIKISYCFIDSNIVFSKNSIKKMPYLARSKTYCILNPYKDFSKLDHEINYDIKNILTIGSYIKIKNHMNLIIAFKEILDLNKNYKEWSLTILGDGPLRNDYENYIKKNNLMNNVFFPKETKSVEKYFKKSSIFVFCSIREALGLALIEAMSFGLPAIVSNCSDSYNDLLIKPNIAKILPHNNIFFLKKNLLQFMNNKKNRSEYGKKSKNIVRYINNEKTYNQLDKIINTR